MRTVTIGKYGFIFISTFSFLDHLIISVAMYVNFFGTDKGGRLSVDLKIPPTSTGLKSISAPVSVIAFRFL